MTVGELIELIMFCNSETLVTMQGRNGIILQIEDAIICSGGTVQLREQHSNDSLRYNESPIQ